MSRHLPEHPSLEYLKKHAKDLLHDMQQRDPTAQLADAQHTIAREYGFPSWPKLKAHVESLARPADRRASPEAAPSQSGDVDEVVNGDDDLSIDPPPLAAPETSNPFLGTWTANLSKSKLHPFNPFQSARLHFDVDGDTVIINDFVVDAAGHEEHNENRFQADGKEHPSEHREAYRLFARWHGSHVLKVVVKKGPQIEGWVTYEVSADGAILTVSTDGQQIVFDRQ